MRKILIGTLFCGIAGLAYADPPKIFADDGTYLGKLGSSLDPESVHNPLGIYGSPLSPNSINNPLGVYGSPYSPQSPNNIFNKSPTSIAPSEPIAPACALGC